VDGHRLSSVLERPNGYQSGMEFHECLTAGVLMKGNGYAHKHNDLCRRSSGAAPQAAWPRVHREAR